MTPSIADYINGFPHLTTPKIQRPPSYEAIADLQRLLNANAASVDSLLGDGTLGYLALTISPEIYATHSVVPFVAPNHPGPLPIIQPTATVALSGELVRQHNEALRIFREHQSVDKALKQQLLGAVDDIYVRTLRDRITGYATVNVWTLIHHLLTTYGRITPNDLTHNDSKMRAPYQPDQPIETLFSQLEDAMAFAAAGGQAYSPEQVVNLAYALVFATGMYNDACKDWRSQCPAANGR